MVEFRSVMFVLSFFFFFFPKYFSQFLHLQFFLLSSFFVPLFLLSPSILVLSLLELFKQVPPFLSSLMKSTSTSACSTSAQTHISQLLSWTHILARLDFDFDFVVAATVITENHLLVLMVRVGVSVRVRLGSMVRWQVAAASTIIWVSSQIRNPSPSSLSHLSLSLSRLNLLRLFWIFDKFENG